jgi:predicted Rossmann-fold nucleotide-binding protein
MFLLKEGTITEADLKLVTLTDDFDEAMAHIRTYVTTNYKIEKKPKKLWQAKL